jgi:hypothetical protein
MGISIYDESLPLNEGASIEDTDSTNWRAIHTGIQSLCRIDSILVTNSDTVDHILNLRLNLDATQTKLCSVSVPAGSGATGLPPVDLILEIPGAMASGIPLYAFSGLEIQAEDAFAEGTGAQITVLGGTL